jgi:lauroyl/myristoyl acyltransferase
MGAWLAQGFGARLIVPVGEVRPRVRQWFFDRVRRSCGLTLVPEADLQLNDVVQELRQGSLVVLMLDRRPSGPGLTLDLMNKPAAVSRAACVFARRADVAVIPIAGALRPDGRRTLHIGTSSRASGVVRGQPAEALMQAVCAPIEALIRARPEQWHLPADARQLPWRLHESERHTADPEPRPAVSEPQPSALRRAA